MAGKYTSFTSSVKFFTSEARIDGTVNILNQLVLTISDDLFQM